MKYRWVTNLRMPAYDVDRHFLSVLGDYRVGDPVEAEPPEDKSFTPRTVEEMQYLGIVGIYTTDEAVGSDAVRELTGWDNVTLGPEIGE